MAESDVIKAVQKKSTLGTVLLAMAIALGGGAAGTGLVTTNTTERLARLEERVEAVQKTVEKIERKLDTR